MFKQTALTAYSLKDGSEKLKIINEYTDNTLVTFINTIIEGTQIKVINNILGEINKVE